MTYEYEEKIKQCDLRTGERRIGSNKTRKSGLGRGWRERVRDAAGRLKSDTKKGRRRMGKVKLVIVKELTLMFSSWSGTENIRADEKYSPGILK